MRSRQRSANGGTRRPLSGRGSCATTRAIAGPRPPFLAESRRCGAEVNGAETDGILKAAGLPIPPDQLLPFFLAARSAAGGLQDIFGGALSSSYEAFRDTRKDRKAALDEQEDEEEQRVDLSQSAWYLGEFDRALAKVSGAVHPKVDPTVKKVVDLWEAGEKVLVFAFFRHTCRALRIHISREIERRIFITARRRLRGTAGRASNRDIRKLLQTIQRRYFDDSDAPGRRAVDTALSGILDARRQCARSGGPVRRSAAIATRRDAADSSGSRPRWPAASPSRILMRWPRTSRSGRRSIGPTGRACPGGTSSMVSSRS